MGCDLEYVVLPSDVYFFFSELKKNKSWLFWVFVAVIRLSLWPTGFPCGGAQALEHMGSLGVVHTGSRGTQA